MTEICHKKFVIKTFMILLRRAEIFCNKLNMRYFFKVCERNEELQITLLKYFSLVTWWWQHITIFCYIVEATADW